MKVENECAPVALFAYKRPHHLHQAIQALAASVLARHTRLYIFCDGPAQDSDSGPVEQTRRVAHSAEGFARIEVIERIHNFGLAASVIAGIDLVLKEHDRVIVLEDDLVVDPTFLDFLNQGLEMYRSDDEVISIHGFTPGTSVSLPQSFFLRGADCWGWGTWRRGWAQFNPDGTELLRLIDESGEQAAFDFDGAYAYRQMLVDQVRGQVNSWAIRWYASAFLARRLTLYPSRSLVRNIGQDGSGTHKGRFEPLEVMSEAFRGPLVRIPLRENEADRAAVAAALRPGRRRALRTMMTQIAMAGRRR
jgi:GT2 family glycosyltransferase